MYRSLASLTCICAGCVLGPLLARGVTIDTVPVGNPANPFDPLTGYGSVSYDYRIGTYPVTNAQYTDFLNAKAASDPLGLYNIEMGSIASFGGITRSGSAGGYRYATRAGRENMPVNHVSWYDAIRFTNWLNNGQGNGETESGAYSFGPLDAAGIPTAGLSITRKTDAKWFLPSEDEWYKAAYHKNNGITANYFRYPTSSDARPTRIAPPGDSNSANYELVVDDLTMVGAYPSTKSPYGVLDMGGNVWNWNEAVIGTFRGLRGGGLYKNSNALLSTIRRDLFSDPALEYSDIGFRVATIPEPGTATLAIVAAALGWILRKRLARIS